MTLFLPLNYCYFSCLTAFPLFLHFLMSLIISYLSLLFGTLGGPRRPKVFFLFCFLLFKTNKKQETWRGLYPGRPHKVLLVSVLTPPFQSASFLSLPFLLSFTFYFVYQH